MAGVGIKLKSCARMASVKDRRPGLESVREPSLDQRLFEIVHDAVREALAASPAEAGPEPLARLVAQALQVKGMFAVQPSSGAITSKSKKITPDGRMFLTSAEIAERWHWNEESVRRKIRSRELGSLIVGRRRLVPLAEVELVERQGLVPRL